MSCAVVPTHPYVWTEGDRRPALQGALTSGGVAVDITGYTIAAKLKRPSTASPVVLTLTVVITNAVGGLFEIQWGATDLLEGRGQLLEIEFNDGSGEIETKRLLIDVTENMG